MTSVVEPITPHSPKQEQIEAVRMAVSPVDHPDQNLPAIRVQHPSPELKEHAFEKEMQNGINKPMTNGWSQGYFGDNPQVDGKLENGVHL